MFKNNSKYLSEEEQYAQYHGSLGKPLPTDTGLPFVLISFLPKATTTDALKTLNGILKFMSTVLPFGTIVLLKYLNQN